MLKKSLLPLLFLSSSFFSIHAAAESETTQLRTIMPCLVDKGLISCSLHHAAGWDHWECIIYLLNRIKCSPNERNEYGETWLHILARKTTFSNSSLRYDYKNNIPKIFVYKAIDLNAQDEDGNTPLHIGLMNRNIFFCFNIMKAGARHDIKNAKGIRSTDLIKEWNSIPYCCQENKDMWYHIRSYLPAKQS